MRARALALGLAAVLCALPILAQDLPAGDDVWDSVGGGSTEVTLSPTQWNNLCGASVGANTSALLKGFNIPGQGTGDTVVRRLEDAVFSGVGSSDTVKIQLQDLSLVNDGSNPCGALGYSLRVTDNGTQATGTMTITKTSSAGGTFTAKVPVGALIEALDSSGTPRGSVFVSGVLGDDSAAPWSYAAPSYAATASTAAGRTFAAAAAAAPWHPGVDPVTKQPAKVCRRGNKILPARHCYQPTPPCPVVKNPVPIGTSGATEAAAIAVAVEQCSVGGSSTN